ncbi:MAG TPA: cell division ATP-binding protein FtsE [Desulfobacterales bacterium]|nr:cell division ATP-binding protein FtsE [Desulfobacterales bacterium]
MTQPVIEITKVSKVYPPDIMALDNISLTVERGEIVLLSGMSGAGKTTLLRLVCGLERASRGMVEVLGHDMARLGARERQLLRQKIGVAYQDFRLLPQLSVFENVAMAMEVTYKPPSVIRRRVEDLLNLLLLSDKQEQKVANLSRGEQQRVAIARAAANAPPIILADEPTGNLDTTLSRQVMQLFEQLNDAGSTILIATHDPTLIDNSPHRRLELRTGRLLDA